MKLFTNCVQRILRTFKNYRLKSDMATRFPRINTLVFFDTETTGLPNQEWGRTRITELSLCAARVHDISKLTSGLPRVINKINLCLNPRKPMEFKASKITGLSNELLEHYSGFDEKVFDMIENFLLRLPQPVCLLAHNGNKFDYPILQAELKNINKRLPDEVLCADTLICFRELYGVVSARKKLFIDGPVAHSSTSGGSMEIDGIRPLATSLMNESSTKQPSSSIATSQEIPTNRVEHDLLSDEWDAELINLSMEFDQKPTASQQQNYARQQMCEVVNMQQINETVPQGQMITQQVTQMHISMQQVNEMTPDKKIFSVKPKSFRLCDIYTHVTQSDAPTNLHCAEADTLALMEAAVCVAPQFLAWVESNAVSFNQLV